MPCSAWRNDMYRLFVYRRCSRAEKNALQNQYDNTIHEVNERISEKSTLQINLNETRDTVRETNEHVRPSVSSRLYERSLFS